jgi:hypothetical protein
MQIPEHFKPGFVVLAGLTNPAFAELLAAVSSAPKTFASTRELDVWITSEVKSIPPGDVTKLIESITSVYRLLSRLSVPASKLATDLLEAAQEGIDNFKVADDVDFTERLTTLLALDSFNIIGLKAKELQRQSERTFCESRILTDLRPVFGNEIGEAPTAMIVVHTLKIVSHETSGHKDFYVALDAEDIASLKKTLERAEEKAQSLKAVLDKTGLRTIDLS